MKKNVWITAGIILFLFPYIVTLFLTGKVTKQTEEIEKSGRIVRITGDFDTAEMDLEEYALGVAAAQIPGDYEAEAIKAQVILVRTYLYKTMGDAEDIESKALSCTYWDTDTRKKEWKDNYSEYQEKFKRAVSETAGQVLTYEGALIDGMFHRASAAMTRDGGESLPYMKSVSGSRDVDMDGYVTIREFSGAELSPAIGNIRGIAVTEEEALKLQIAAREESGYVQTVLVGTEEYTGDEIAATLSLPSSAFSVTQTDKGLKFVDKGSGHGYGLSQWGANKLAGEGMDAVSILSYYFQNVSIEVR